MCNIINSTVTSSIQVDYIPKTDFGSTNTLGKLGCVNHLFTIIQLVSTFNITIGALDDLVQECGVKKGKQTRLKIYVNDFPTNHNKDIIDLKRRLNRVGNEYIKFKAVQTKIEQLQRALGILKQNETANEAERNKFGTIFHNRNRSRKINK